MGIKIPYILTTLSPPTLRDEDRPKGGRNQLEPTGTKWMSDNTRQDDRPK